MTLQRKYLGDKVVLFVFLLSTLLVLAPKQFHYGDGFIAYKVARSLVEKGTVDLPEDQGRDDMRIIEGRGGKYFAIYQPGQSILFIFTILADKLSIRLSTLLPGSFRVPALVRPFVFSKSANSWVLAMTGVCMFTLLGDCRISRRASLLTTMLYVFGSMALVYSTLSFNVSLRVLLLLGTLLFLFRAVEKDRPLYWLYSGLLFGFSLITRPDTIIFLLPISVYILLGKASHCSRGRARQRGPIIFMISSLPFILLFFYYNYYRFGSPLETGHRQSGFELSFNASLLESVPALLFSPGRSIFVYSPLLILALLGVPIFMRADYKKSLAVIVAAILNLFFFAKISWWATPNAWGPRYQLTTVALLFIPLAYWLDTYGRKASSRIKWIAIPVFALCVAFQLVPVIAGYQRAGTDYSAYWYWDKAQVRAALENFRTVITGGHWSSMRLWWVSPEAHDLPIKLLLIVILAVALVSLIALCRAHRNKAPADS